jgi:SNF2 family DNA or RNA helicase
MTYEDAMEKDSIPNTLESTLCRFPIPSIVGVKRKRDNDEFLIKEDVVTSIIDSSEERQLTDMVNRMGSNNMVLPKKKRAKTENDDIFKIMEERMEINIKVKKLYQFDKIITQIPRFQIKEHDFKYMDYTMKLTDGDFTVKIVDPSPDSPRIPYPFQLDALDWLHQRDLGRIKNKIWKNGIHGAILAMKMGLGKTYILVLLILMSIEKQRLLAEPTLIVAPKTLLGSIRYELVKFSGDQLKILTYNRDMQRKQYNTFNSFRDYDVVITNYKTIMHRCLHAGILTNKQTPSSEQKGGGEAFFRTKWYRVMLDESHEIRNSKSKTFKSLIHLDSNRKHCMTGTPVCNKLDDLHSQLVFTGMSPQKFSMTDGVNQYDKLGLLNFVYFKDEKDADISLPKLIEKIVYFELDSKQRIYHEFLKGNLKKIVTDSKNVVGHSKVVYRFKAKASIVRLMQCCTAPFLTSSESIHLKSKGATARIAELPNESMRSWIQNINGTAGVGTTKIQTCVDLIQHLDAKGGKTIIYANYVSTVNLIIEALVKRDPLWKIRIASLKGTMDLFQRNIQLQRFRLDETCAVLMSTYKIGSQGLNLNHAQYIILAEPWFCPAVEDQAVKRAHRIGQLKDVTVFRLLGKNSIEERISHIAKEKKNLIENVKMITESGKYDMDMNDIYKLCDDDVKCRAPQSFNTV